MLVENPWRASMHVPVITCSDGRLSSSGGEEIIPVAVCVPLPGTPASISAKELRKWGETTPQSRITADRNRWKADQSIDSPGLGLWNDVDLSLFSIAGGEECFWGEIQVDDGGRLVVGE
ncbi:hypothetical protein PMIN02_001645 [Paraphaeosphaeria minitans]